MIKIGLTGSIGCGKTTVAGIFFKNGATVLNADTIIHELMESNVDIKARIIAEYGTDIVDDKNRSIDRGKLALKCFRGKRELQPLLSIVYPALRQVASANNSCLAP